MVSDDARFTAWPAATPRRWAAAAGESPAERLGRPSDGAVAAQELQLVEAYCAEVELLLASAPDGSAFFNQCSALDQRWLDACFTLRYGALTADPMQAFRQPPSGGVVRPPAAVAGGAGGAVAAQTSGPMLGGRAGDLVQRHLRLLEGASPWASAPSRPPPPPGRGASGGGGGGGWRSGGAWGHGWPAPSLAAPGGGGWDAPRGREAYGYGGWPPHTGHAPPEPLPAPWGRAPCSGGWPAAAQQPPQPPQKRDVSPPPRAELGAGVLPRPGAASGPGAAAAGAAAGPVVAPWPCRSVAPAAAASHF